MRICRIIPRRISMNLSTRRRSISISIRMRMGCHAVNTPAVTTNTTATMIPPPDHPRVYTTSPQFLLQQPLQSTSRTIHPVQALPCALGVPLAQTGPDHPDPLQFLARNTNGPILTAVHDQAHLVPGTEVVRDVHCHQRRCSQHRRLLVPGRTRVLILVMAMMMIPSEDMVGW